jgi:hypothetical protein
MWLSLKLAKINELTAPRQDDGKEEAVNSSENDGKSR